MLRSLSIRDIVLIDRLDFSFRKGLCVLTGETGAGKSILLDALGLTLGARAVTGMVRHGARQAVVGAEFDIARNHPARRLLAEHGLGTEDPLILRRVISGDGGSRAFVNDQPVSAALLREIGATLVEIQGQHASRELLNPGMHAPLLDAFGGLEGNLDTVGSAHRGWVKAVEAEAEAEAALEGARRDEQYLRHNLAELEALAPEPGEAARLAEDRAFLRNGAKLAEAVDVAYQELTAGRSIEAALGAARRAIDGEANNAGGRLDGISDFLASAAIETAEAVAKLESVMAELDFDPRRLEEVEERLFALQAAARKYDTDVDSLARLGDDIAAKLSELDTGADNLARLARGRRETRKIYLDAAKHLRRRRMETAPVFDRAVAAELAPLKLKRALFRTRIEPLAEADWRAAGTERATFEISTIPDTPPGPLARIASGGELARIMLALKVVLSGRGSVPTLVFDEVDSGIGGAVAAAVGERLARLGSDMQVLVVTHSPQVAARGAHHWRVLKRDEGARLVTQVDELDATDRREEIARMLAGAKVTDEARAAADRLLAAGR
ncbi:MAG: DNA repair protein RecN [Proteobacteria bacterium]|nr:DNA repair protein RecN [Pseudomonadota bacterium]